MQQKILSIAVDAVCGTKQGHSEGRAPAGESRPVHCDVSPKGFQQVETQHQACGVKSVCGPLAGFECGLSKQHCQLKHSLRFTPLL